MGWSFDDVNSLLEANSTTRSDDVRLEATRVSLQNDYANRTNFLENLESLSCARQRFVMGYLLPDTAASSNMT